MRLKRCKLFGHKFSGTCPCLKHVKLCSSYAWIHDGHVITPEACSALFQPCLDTRRRLLDPALPAERGILFAALFSVTNSSRHGPDHPSVLSMVAPVRWASSPKK